MVKPRSVKNPIAEAHRFVDITFDFLEKMEKWRMDNVQERQTARDVDASIKENDAKKSDPSDYFGY